MAYSGKRLAKTNQNVYAAVNRMNRTRKHRRHSHFSFNMGLSLIGSFLVLAVTIGALTHTSNSKNISTNDTAPNAYASTLAYRVPNIAPNYHQSIDLTADMVSNTDMDTTNNTNDVVAPIEDDSVTTTRLGVVIDSYDPHQDYTSLISDAYDQITDENEEHILGLCEIYEEQRNLKVKELYPDTYDITHTFVASNTAEDIEDILNPHQPYMEYTEEEAIMLACIVYAEAGSSWITDQHQRDVASVVINRVNSPLFKQDNIYDVIHAPGQYPATCNNTKYNERCYANAVYVLENGPVSDGIFQANFKQGTEVINTYRYGDNVTYICK